MPPLKGEAYATVELLGATATAPMFRSDRPVLASDQLEPPLAHLKIPPSAAA